MAVYVNFIFFLVYLSYIATQEALRAGYVIDSQKSVIILLLMVGALSWAGKWLMGLAGRIEDEQTREGVSLSTFIWAGHAAGLIFAPSQKLSALAFIPLLAIGMAAYWPLFFRARGYTPLLAGLSALTQAASLALILRVGGDFISAFGVAVLLWLVIASFVARRFANPDDGGWGAALSLGQAIPVAWFFLNISNQVISYSSMASGAFMALALAGFAFAAWAGYRAAFAERPEGWIVWAPGMLFGLSLMVNFNIVQSVDLLASNFDLWIREAHFWFHVQPGLDYFYNAALPFFEFSPNEGALFGIYLSRWKFIYLDSSISGYIFSLYLMRCVSILLFIYVTWIGLVEGLKASRTLSLAIAITIAVTNIIPVQLYIPWNYSWVAAERMQILFVSFLTFRLFSLYEERIKEGKPGSGHSAALLGFLTGAIHGFSLLYEPSFGAPSTIGLLMAVGTRHLSARNILAVAAGGFSAGLVYIAISGVPLVNFFYHYPIGLVSLGKVAVHNWGTNKESVLACFEYKQPHQIFDALSRSRLPLTLHHTVMISAFLLFMAKLPFRAGSSRLSGLAVYLFTITFALYISRGQSFTGIYMGPYTLLAHLNMTYPLFPAMLAYGAGVLWNMDGPAAKRLTGAIRLAAATWLAIGVINGVHMQPDGMPGWLPYQYKELPGGVKAPYISRGMGEALDHLYSSLNRNAVLAGPRIPDFFARPYSAVRDTFFERNGPIEYWVATPPYRFKVLDPLAHCAYCLKGPDFTGDLQPRIYGKSAMFQWKDMGFGEYNFFIRSSGDFRIVHFSKVTHQTALTADNLPTDGSEMIAEVRAWTKEGRPVRTFHKFLSLPETIFTHNRPIPLASNDEDGPKLAGDVGYIIPGTGAKISWTDIGADKYEVSISGQRTQKRGSVNMFIATTEETSATVTGLPANCGNVYLHLEAYVNGEWKRSSYLLFSAPEEFRRNRDICGSTGEPPA